MTINSRIVAFVVCLLAFDVEAGDYVAAALKRTIEESARYQADENLKRYMTTMHPQSPSYAATEKGVLYLFESFDLHSTNLNFRYIGSDDEYAYARVRQRTVKITGMSYKNNEIEKLFVFKKHGDRWKYWTSTTLSFELI